MKPASTLGVWCALGLSACGAFGPERDPPKLPVTADYSVNAQPEFLPLADGARQRLVNGMPPPTAWWTAYRSETLNAWVEEGLAHSATLAAAQSTLRAARETLRAQIGNSVLPSVDLVVSPARQRTLGIPTLPQETFLENVFVAQVEASYTFDFFGAAVLADRSLAHQVRQQAYQFEATRRAFAANIVVAAINAASLQAQVAATERLVDLGEQRARQTAARFAQGSAARDEVFAAEQDAANAAATLPSLRAQALAMRHAQAVLLGRLPDQAPVPLALTDLKLPEQIPLSIPSELLAQRPDILAADAAVRAAADQAGAAAAAMLPSMTLSASYGRGGFDWSTFTSPAGVIWGVGASLTQPLFRGGALLARKRQYRATYDATVAQYRQTVLSAFQNVADTLASLDEDANTLSQTQRAADAARSVRNDTESKYKLGAAPFYATLSAAQQAESAEVQLIRARAARLADTAGLLQSMGNPPSAPRSAAQLPGR